MIYACNGLFLLATLRNFLLQLCGFLTCNFGYFYYATNRTDVFRERVAYFIPTIAEAHKDIPIVCTDIFMGGNDFFMDQPIFDFRDIVREVAIKYERKNKLFKYICGKDLLTTYEGLTVDQLHPNTVGMIDIGDNLYEAFNKL